MKNGLVTVPTEVSIQGSSLSPLLSNIVLDELDKELERKELTPRGTHVPVGIRIKEINKWYVGWSNYFKMTQYPFSSFLVNPYTLI